MLLLCNAINSCEIIQNNIKYFAFIVVGNKTPKGTKTNNLALGKRYKYAPINAETIPEEPTIGLIL